MDLTCPTCRHPLSAPAGAAGQKVLCPCCGQKLQLQAPPKPAADNKTILVTPEPNPPATPTPTRARDFWLGLTVLLALAAVVLLSTYLLTRRREPHYTVAELVTGYRAELEGTRARVTGLVLDAKPLPDGSGLLVLLHAPGTRFQVAAVGVAPPRLPLRPDSRVTVVGLIGAYAPGERNDLVILRQAALE
jgi:hypothetical protein